MKVKKSKWWRSQEDKTGKKCHFCCLEVDQFFPIRHLIIELN